MLKELHYCMRSIYYVPEEMHHCMCPIFDVPEERHHYICSILHVPEEMHHCMCPKKCIIGCARYCMCPKKCIITLCPRLHCTRSLHVPESNQVISINRYVLCTLYLYSKGVILQRHHLSWPADFMPWPEDLFYAYYVPKAS